MRAVQQRLTELGYWNGPADGVFGGLTIQAVYALQKSAGLGRDGVIGPKTMAALTAGVTPTPTLTDGIEIDKAKQILMVVEGGELVWTFNTSTGGGYSYTSSAGYPAIAATPGGTFSVYRSVDGVDVGKLGALYRPRYFNGGIAVHGAPYIPPYPASHGCARVSNPAMDFIWSQDFMPKGSTVLVH
ncbi:MAG: L,D-transpeptidase family protein [Nostocoides sp.]